MFIPFFYFVLVQFLSCCLLPSSKRTTNVFFSRSNYLLWAEWRKRYRVLEVQRVFGLQTTQFHLLRLVHQRLDTKPAGFRTEMTSQCIQTCKRFATAPLCRSIFEEAFTLEVLHSLMKMFMTFAVMGTCKRLGTHQTFIRTFRRMCLHVQLKVIRLGEGLTTCLARMLCLSVFGPNHLIIRPAASSASWGYRVTH